MIVVFVIAPNEEVPVTANAPLNTASPTSKDVESTLNVLLVRKAPTEVNVPPIDAFATVVNELTFAACKVVTPPTANVPAILALFNCAVPPAERVDKVVAPADKLPAIEALPNTVKF